VIVRFHESWFSFRTTTKLLRGSSPQSRAEAFF
jgi:hypothetical protein